MKKYLFFFLLSLPVLTASAQSIFEKDSVLRKLNDSLPKGWVMKQQDSFLIITRIKPIYKVWANHMNEPMDRNTEIHITTDDDTPPAGAKKDTMRFMYKMIPRWSAAKYKRAEALNDSIHKEDEKLRTLHKEGGTVYRPKGKDEGTTVIKGDPAVDAYNQKLEDKMIALRKMRTDIPSYCSQFYFLVYQDKKITPHSDDDPMFHDIFPKQAELERIQIQVYNMEAWCSTYRMYHKRQ